MNYFSLVFVYFSLSTAFSLDFPIDSINDPEKIIWKMGHKTSQNINVLNKIAPMNAQTTKIPWSGYYWPYTFSGAAYRYNDSSFQKYISRNRAESVFPYLRDYTFRSLRNSSFHTSFLNTLSPAEKYDVLIGDKNFTLTKSILSKTESLYSASKSIPQWFGICHGWAPASMMTDLPLKAITIPLKNGESLKFYPEDIMALQSLIWARTGSDLSGRRCEKSRVRDNQRTTDLSCVDLNPGAFHLALLNQIGINKKALIVDKNRTNEVWNHPVFKYEAKYFNTLSKMAYSEFKKNLVSIDRVQHRQRYRSQKTKYIIGVKLKYYYTDVSYTLGSLKRTPKMNIAKSIKLYYDLELDASLNVIGGEWRSENYPDFAWVPKKTPLSVFGEKMIKSVVTTEGYPSKDIIALALGGKIQGKAIKGFSKHRMPIPSLVNYLLKKSRE